MKILHTSDWHIGQRLYNKIRDEEHRLFFDWLIAQVEEHQVDAIIVAGDIFDIAYPSNTSLSLYYEILMRLVKTTCKHIIIIGGNHDSATTLNAPREILQFINIHVIGGVPERFEDQVIELKNELGEMELVVCAVPYLRDKDVRQSVAGESHEERVTAIRDGILNHYAKLEELTEKYRDKNIPIIATGHLFLSGTKTSDSEREIHIGNLQEIAASQLPQSFDYYALGHIHRPQIVEKNEKVRYSGAPIPLSFSERKDEKSVILLDFQKELIIKQLQIPVFRKLVRFKGTYAEVSQKIFDYKNIGGLTDWAEIIVEEEFHNSLLYAQLESLIESITEMEIINYKLFFKDKVNSISELYENAVSLDELDAKDVFKRLIEKENTESQELLLQTFNELFQSAVGS